MASIKRGSQNTSDESQRKIRRRVHEKSWRGLNSKQKRIRKDSLQVLRSARTSPNRSLTHTIREHNKTAQKKIALRTVLNNTGAFTKKKNRWVANPDDAIPRSMEIAENGRMISVETRDSREASKIGRYHRAVKEYLEDGKLKKLREFGRMTVTDSRGRVHRFETDLEKVREVNAIAKASDHPQVYSK